MRRLLIGLVLSASALASPALAKVESSCDSVAYEEPAPVEAIRPIETSPRAVFMYAIVRFYEDEQPKIIILRRASAPGFDIFLIPAEHLRIMRHRDDFHARYGVANWT